MRPLMVPCRNCGADDRLCRGKVDLPPSRTRCGKVTSGATVREVQMIDGETPGRHERYPRYELVSIPLGEGVPRSVGRELSTIGVPRGLIGHEYRALESAGIYPDSTAGILVTFGARGLYGCLCVNIENGNVVSVSPGPVPAILPVNRDLDSFRRCVAAVINRFPFYDAEEDYDRYEDVAEEVRSIVLGIDGTVMNEDDFWVTFTDDLAMGDYSTEQVLGMGE